MRASGMILAVVGGAALVVGCQQHRGDVDPMVELLLPQRVRIVEPFTEFTSFDDDDKPDGLTVLLQPIDSFGDSVKIAGLVRVELYYYVQASGNRAARRVCEPWEISLTTQSQQRRYWNTVTGMYEIPVKLPPGLNLGARKYVVMLTYNTPLETHLTDEATIELPVAIKT